MNHLIKPVKVFPFVLLLLHFITVVAQEESFHNAPSLQLGLGSLDFTKGAIDKELVLEIIADKKLEVKNQLVKSMLLDKIDGAGGTVYSYMDNLLNTLIYEKSQEVQVKKALESSVNLSFVYAFTNYYLYTLDSGKFKNINKLAMASGCYLPSDRKTRLNPKTLHSLANNYYLTQHDNIRTLNEINNIRIVAILMDIAAEVVNNNKSLKTLGLNGSVTSDSYLYHNQYLNLSNCPEAFNDFAFYRRYIGNKQYIESISISEQRISFINEHLSLRKDNISQIKNLKYQLEIKEEFLAELMKLDTSAMLDFVQKKIEIKNAISEQDRTWVNHAKEILEDLNNLHTYKYEDYVNEHREETLFEVKELGLIIEKKDRKIEQEVKNIQSEIDTLKSNMDHNLTFMSHYRKCYADIIYTDMKEVMNTLVDNIGFVWYLNDLTKNTDFSKVDEKDIISLLNSGIDYDNKKFNKLVSKAKKDLSNVLDSVKMTPSQYSIVTETLKYLNKLNYVDIEKNKFNKNADILYHLNKAIIPNFIELISASPDIIDISDMMEQMSKALAKQLISDEKNLKLYNQNQVFFTILGKLYELNIVSTYNDYLNALTDIGDTYPSHRVQTALNTTISLLKDYLTFSEKNETLTVRFDVETSLLKLSNIKYHRYQPFKFHFTLGANTLNFAKGIEMDDEILKTYSFVGEKIGLKYVIRDWDFTNTFQKGETYKYYGKTNTRKIPAKKPSVSNVHILLYGSGIIYNLVNTGTTANFNAPLLGIGPGLTFFNNLDLNITFGVPLIAGNSFRENLDYNYWSVGFDIQFTEYYNKVREKQQAKKKQEQLIELQKAM